MLPPIPNLVSSHRGHDDLYATLGKENFDVVVCSLLRELRKLVLVHAACQIGVVGLSYQSGNGLSPVDRAHGRCSKCNQTEKKFGRCVQFSPASCGLTVTALKLAEKSCIRERFLLKSYKPILERERKSMSFDGSSMRNSI